MNPTCFLAPALAASLLCATGNLEGQSFRLDSIQYDSFGGLITLGWQSQPGGIYSIHSTTNLNIWEEIKISGLPLRITGASGSRTQVELDVPAGDRRFWRVGMRPIFDVGTAISEGVGLSYPVLTDVNDASRVVGYFVYGNNAQIGFTWALGEEISSFGNGSYATAVNSGGTVVGTRYGNGKFFSWTKSGGLVELGNGAALDINESGHILGRDDSPGAFLWKPGTGKIYIPHLSATEPYTVPEALSDAGHVVGVSLIDGNYYRAFLWTESGGLVDLTGALSSAASGATDVNSSGQVVGYRTVTGSTRAYSWTAAGGFVTFPAGCYITDLSENGKVVGRGYLVGNQAHAFSWTQAGGIIDLGDGQPEQVNELGQIVGNAGNSAVVWSPTGGRTELESPYLQPHSANLINDAGIVFGTSRVPNAAAIHVVMWTTNPPP